MRTRINLASQPYEDAKQYLARYGTLVLLLAIATVALVLFTIHSLRRSSDINRQLSQMNTNLERLDDAKRSAERMLALPQNHGTVQRSEFLNSIFARKAFSWTTVFSDMERVMPPGLRVLSIQPTLDDQNQLIVHIIVGGSSRDRAIQLVQNLEKTPRFRDVQLRSDIMSETQQVSGRYTGTSNEDKTDPIRFDIIARYLPALPSAASSSAAVQDAKTPENVPVAKNGGRP